MRFEYGIAAGDVTMTSAVIWTKVAPDSVVEWELGTADGGRRGGSARSDSGGFVHVVLDDLKPGAVWRYRFRFDGIWSRQGCFRTVPATGPVRFAVVSCAKFNSGFFNAYSAVAERDDLDFVLHLGDYIYEAGQIPRGKQTPGIDIGRPFEPIHDCVTADDYDRRYAQYRRDPDLQLLHERHGLIFTLDDHEIADNAWSGGAEEHFEEDGPWEIRLRNALTAWQNWQPTTRRVTDGDALWQSCPLGNVGHLFMCDSRLSRTDPFAVDGPEKSILGRGQAGSLLAAARETTAPWFVIGMPSKFMSLDAARRDELNDLVLRTLKLSGKDGEAFHDRWDSYACEREWLLRELRKVPTSSLLLCGDVHFAAYSEESYGDRVIAECVTSSVTSPNFDDKMGWAHGSISQDYEASMVSSVPDLKWCDLDRHGFLIVELTADAFSCEWWGVATVRERRAEADLLHRVELSSP